MLTMLARMSRLVKKPMMAARTADNRHVNTLRIVLQLYLSTSWRHQVHAKYPLQQTTHSKDTMMLRPTNTSPRHQGDRASACKTLYVNIGTYRHSKPWRTLTFLHPENPHPENPRQQPVAHPGWQCSRVGARSPEAAPMVTCAAMGVPNLGETLAQNPGIMCSRAAMVQIRDWPIMFTSSAVVMPTSAMAATTNLCPRQRHCQLG